MNKLNKSKLIVLLIVFILIITSIAILIFKPFDNTINNENPILEANEIVKQDDDEKLAKELWETNSAKSDDYIGTIKFESGIIDLPFVQGESNETYYRTDWESMEYDEEGSIFMDSSNTLSDQNIILIGHYVYASYEASGTHKFTPLAKLLDESNYENNKYVKLYLENEIREYEIAYVYYCELITDENNGVTFQYVANGLDYYIPNYTNEEFNSYIEKVKENSLYDTGVTLEYNDSILTLQTCVENHDELREIVLLKEINRKSFD